MFFSSGSLFKFFTDVAPFSFHPTPKYNSFWGGNDGDAKRATRCNGLEKENDPARSVNSTNYTNREVWTTSDLEIVVLMHQSPRIISFCGLYEAEALISVDPMALPVPREQQWSSSGSWRCIFCHEDVLRCKSLRRVCRYLQY